MRPNRIHQFPNLRSTNFAGARFAWEVHPETARGDAGAQRILNVLEQNLCLDGCSLGRGSLPGSTTLPSVSSVTLCD